MFDRGTDWIRLLLLGAALFLLAWAARWVIARVWRLKEKRSWRRAEQATGLPLLRAEAGPADDDRRSLRLEGVYAGRSCVVRTIHDASRKGARSLARLDLQAPSPVRLRFRREGPLALLGQLAEAGFRKEALEHSEALEVEGDREVLRELLRGPLRPLLGSFQDWTLEIGPRHVTLSRPGTGIDPDEIQARLDLLTAVAEQLERSSN